MRTTFRWLLAVVLFCSVSAPVAASSSKITVMTRNVYLGADLSGVLAARTTAEFLAAVSAVFAQVQSTNFPERAERLAEEIAENEPLLVGLQEVAIWRSQFPADFSRTPNATTVEYDFLDVLLAELAERELDYSAVVVAPRADIEAPGLTPAGPKEYRLTMRDVILIRQDSKPRDIELSNIREAPFVRNLVLTTFAGPVVFTRGWGSVDVTIDDSTFRFVNTHLEAFTETIRIAQAAELLAGPANTDIPIIVAGDFNAAPSTATYNLLADAGLVDAAFEDDGELAEFTCCQASDLRNAESRLTVRIDLVLFRGDVTSKKVDVIGDREEDRTESGLWPSDHAGVVARIKIGPLKHVDEGKGKH